MKRFFVLLSVLVALAPGASIARADGGPGSDVLVYQPVLRVDATQRVRADHDRQSVSVLVRCLTAWKEHRSSAVERPH